MKSSLRKLKEVLPSWISKCWIMSSSLRRLTSPLQMKDCSKQSFFIHTSIARTRIKSEIQRSFRTIKSLFLFQNKATILFLLRGIILLYQNLSKRYQCTCSIIVHLVLKYIIIEFWSWIVNVPKVALCFATGKMFNCLTIGGHLPSASEVATGIKTENKKRVQIKWDRIWRRKNTLPIAAG